MSVIALDHENKQNKRFVFVVIRVPKSGSTSLANMMRDSLKQATVYALPPGPEHLRDRPLIERMRKARNRIRTLRHKYGAFRMEMAWQRISSCLQSGDVVTGHIHYGDPILPGVDLKYITLVREPAARVLSHYNYTRFGFNNRHFYQKLYHWGPDRVAAYRDFSGYLSWLDEHRAQFGDMITRYVCGNEQVEDPLEFLRTNYFHIGTMENMDLYLRRLSDKLGVTITMRRDNVMPHKEATHLRASDRPIFERVFARDIEIYEAVRRLEAGGH